MNPLLTLRIHMVISFISVKIIGLLEMETLMIAWTTAMTTTTNFVGIFVRFATGSKNFIT